jgi:hypothetical protein
VIPEITESCFDFFPSVDILRGVLLVFLVDFLQLFLQGIDGALAGVDFLAQLECVISGILVVIDL